MAREHYWSTGSNAAQDQEKRALAAEHDRQVRNRSVANDIRLDLPVSVARPDGEEYPARRLRSHDKVNEIQKPYIKGPPNKTVWDSRDCLERTVTQPSSSSSSRSGGSKSTSKSSSSHWGLSWSRSNKSPPSQGRNSRGQQRHPHVLNPSSVRNAPSSCETARGNSGGGGAAGNGGLLAGPSLQSTFMPLSSSTLGSIPNSSLIGFHGAASIAGDNSAFPNHNQSSFSSHQSTPVFTSSKQPQHHHQPVVFPGGGGTAPSPSIAERFSEKVQQCTNVIVGNHTRTSPNNNNSSSATSTHQQQQSNSSVFSRLIDPESKLFSRNSSKESKRSNNINHGKNGKSHRTDQSSSASSSPGGSASSLVESGAQAPGTIFPQQALQHEQLQQQQFNYFQQSRNSQSQQSQSVPIPPPPHHQHHPQQFMAVGMPPMHEGSSSSISSSCSVPTTNPFLNPSFDGRGNDEGMIIKHSNNNVVMPLLRSQTPDNNNPNCSLSGGSRTSSGRSGPRSFDAYCGADAGAIHNICSDRQAGGLMADIAPTTRFHDVSSSQPQQQGSPIPAMSDCENGNKCSSARNKNSDESNGRVPPVAATVQSLTSQQHCGASDTNTLKLSQSSFPHPTRTGGSDDANSILVVKDKGMKGLGVERGEQQQQQKQDAHARLPGTISSSVSFSQDAEWLSLSSSVPTTPFNFNNAATLFQRESIPPQASPSSASSSSSPHPALATASFAAAAESSVLPKASSCSGKERKRSGFENCTFSSSGCSTDPNYSTFDNDNDKLTDNNCCTPSTSPPHPFSSSRENKSHLQSQDERNNDGSRMIVVSDHDNFNTDCSSSSSHCQQQQRRPEFTPAAADHDVEQMISESTVSCATTVITNANNAKDVEESGESMTCEKPCAVRETAHDRELSVVASKNDTTSTTTSSFDQYCKVAAASTAELITSLHSSPSTNNNSTAPTTSSATSSSALSLASTSSNPPLMSSSSPVASHHQQQQEQNHHQSVVDDIKFDYDMQHQ